MWQALLAFVNCHLYRSISAKYPPILDPRLEAFAAGMYFDWFFKATNFLPISFGVFSNVVHCSCVFNEHVFFLNL